jgi:peptide/nickel transport system permease protein
MLTTLRDLLRYNVEFRIGAILVGLVAVMAALSYVSP